jgi:hypothetical protein
MWEPLLSVVCNINDSQSGNRSLYLREKSRLKLGKKLRNPVDSKTYNDEQEVIESL